MVNGQLADPPVNPVRRRIMQAVRGMNTAPERAVRSALFARGYRFRKNVRELPGKPDVVLGARRIAIFVHGCFWHRHAGCRLATTPKTRADFWNEKFRRNLQRDSEIKERLQNTGWVVIEVWQCDVESGAFLAPLVEAIGPPKCQRGGAGRTNFLTQTVG